MRSEEEILRDLWEEGTLYVQGEIVGATVDRIAKAIAWFNATKRVSEIELVINSHGGSAIAGLQMYEIIRSSEIPVKGMVVRQAFSSAAIILQACHRRAAFSSAQIMFHDSWVEGGVICVSDAPEDIITKLGTARERLGRVHAILAKRMNRSLEEAAKFCRAEMRLSAQEALERGLIDEVVDLIP